MGNASNKGIDHFELLQVIELIQYAALQPELWPDTLHRIAALVNTDKSALILFDSETDFIKAQHTYGNNTPVEEEYREHFSRLDTGARFIRAREQGFVATRHQMQQCDESLYNHEFEQWAHDHGHDYRIGSNILDRTHFQADLTLQRGFKQGDFTETELTMVRCLAPHLRHAIEVSSRIGLLQQERRLLSRKLDEYMLGILLLDGQGGVLQMNRYADEILTTSALFGIRKGRVYCSRKDWHDRMQSALAACERFPARACDRFIVADRSERYEVLIHPDREADSEASLFTLQRVSAIMLLSDPDKRAQLSENALINLYDLSRAEAEVLVLLSKGLSLREIADLRQRRLDTIRKQLKAIQRKTDCHRQQDLIDLANRSTAKFLVD